MVCVRVSGQGRLNDAVVAIQGQHQVAYFKVFGVHPALIGVEGVSGCRFDDLAAYCTRLHRVL